MRSLLLSATTISVCLQWALLGLAAEKPNIIFIMADDLGYADLGCYGQQVIQTPRLDHMAQQGMRFTQFYAGCPVCAPSRSVLMTGQHSGHTHVRGNAGRENMLSQSLRDEDVTMAEVLKSAGYHTGLIGKWGLGEVDQPGFPLRQGFDSLFGYLNQVHAHNYYPEFLYRNDQLVKLRNEVQLSAGGGGEPGFVGGYATKRVDYSHDLFANEALEFVRANAAEPFFLYLALTIPHANNEAARMVGDGAEVPTYGIYANQEWPNPDKGQAAMITRMDGDIGRLLDLIKELSIDENTLVFFTSDNGPHDESNHDIERFNPSGPLTGIKRSLTEGGVRVPMIARWPGKIKAGTVSEHVGYFADVLPTLIDLTAAEMKVTTDGISFLPTLTGSGQQKEHEYLYWEFYEQGSRQSVRFGDWVAIRQPMFSGQVSLFNLKQDIAEQHDLAEQNPDMVAKGIAYMEQAHTHNPNWKPSGSAVKQ